MVTVLGGGPNPEDLTCTLGPCYPEEVPNFEFSHLVLHVVSVQLRQQLLRSFRPSQNNQASSSRKKTLDGQVSKQILRRANSFAV